MQMENLNRLLVMAIDLAVISLLVVIAAMSALPDWRASRWILLSGLTSGILVGMIARESGAPEWVVIVFTALGVITGPPTLVKLQHRTLDELLEEFIRRKKNGGIDPTPPGDEDKKED